MRYVVSPLSPVVHSKFCVWDQLRFHVSALNMGPQMGPRLGKCSKRNHVAIVANRYPKLGNLWDFSTRFHNYGVDPELFRPVCMKPLENLTNRSQDTFAITGQILWELVCRPHSLRSLSQLNETHTWCTWRHVKTHMWAFVALIYGIQMASTYGPINQRLGE